MLPPQREPSEDKNPYAPPSEDAPQAAPQSRFLKTLILWLGLIFLFMIVWTVLRRDQAPTLERETPARESPSLSPEGSDGP